MLGAGLALAVTSTPLGVARAQDAGAQQQLEQAEQALVSLDYDTANKGAARVLQMHGLTHDQLVRTYRVLALTDAVLDKETAARDAFQQLLTVDPSYQADPNLSPKVQAPFMEARGFLRAQAVQPGLDVSVTARASEPGTIRATTRDPLHIAKHIVAAYRWGSEGAFTTVPLPVGEGSADVLPPPIGTTRLDYYVQALNANDDVVFEAGSPKVPKTTTVEVTAAPARAPAEGGAPPAEEEHHSIFASPVFWTIAGVVVAGAAVGTYFATKGGTTTVTVAGTPAGAALSPSFQCGTQRCN